MKQIFVLGCYRTGTTWLGTMLCQHKDIAGILGGIEEQFANKFLRYSKNRNILGAHVTESLSVKGRNLPIDKYVKL